MAVVPTQVAVSTSVPTLTLAAGTAGGLAAAVSIDPVNDYLSIYTSSATATQGINRNTLLGISSQPLGLSDVQSPTNKTFNNTNTLTVKDGSLTLQNTSDTTKQANFSLAGNTTSTTRTYTLPNASVTLASLTGTETFTNKTLTSPTINAPNITNATITADALTGYTTSNTGTFYGISVTTGVITTAGSVGAGANATNGVQAAALATNAITLGIGSITANVGSLSSTTNAQITGLTTTVTIPAGGRKVKITLYIGSFANSASASNNTISIWSGTVGSGTQLASTAFSDFSAGGFISPICFAVYTPSSGSITYNAGYTVGSGTGSIAASATAPSFILVEAI